MALKKHIVGAKFTSGVDAGGKHPHVVMESLIKAENAVFERQGAISKRNGTIADSGTHADKHLANFRDGAVSYGAKMAVRNSGDTDWDQTAGDLLLADIAASQVDFLPGREQMYADIAELGNIRIVSYVDATEHVVVKSFDRYSGIPISTITFANTENKRPAKVIATDTELYYFYCSTDATAKLYYGVCSTTTGFFSEYTDVSSLSAIPEPHDDYPSLDVAYLADSNKHIAIAYITKTSRLLAYVFLDTSSSPSVTGQGTVAAITCTLVSVAKFGLDPGGSAQDIAYFVSVYDNGANKELQQIALYSSGATASSGARLGTSTWAVGANDLDVIQVAAINRDPADNRMDVYYVEQNYAGDTNTIAVPKLKHVQGRNTGGTLTTSTNETELLHGHKLASRPFKDTDLNDYVLAYFEGWLVNGADDVGTLQHAYHLLKMTAHPTGVGNPPTWEVIGKAQIAYAAQPWAGGGSGKTGQMSHLSHVISEGTNMFGLAGHRRRDSATVGLTKLVIDVSDTASNKARETDTHLQIPNSCPYEYDGQAFVEQGFLCTPEMPPAVVTGASGGVWAVSGGVGLYSCLVVPEWFDTQGNRHQGTPAVQSATVAVVTDKITWEAACVYITRKEKIWLAFYREATIGQGNYKRLGAVLNDVTADSVTLDDTGLLLDANEFLYTVGGRLEHVSTPPHRVSCLHQQRRFYVPRDAEETTIGYGHVALPNTGSETTDGLQVRVTADGGRIRALESFLGSLIIFKENEIYRASGYGRVPSGLQGGYTEPRLLHKGIGCINDQSIVHVPDGLMFLSHQGIMLLDKGLQLKPVGRPVKYHTDTLTIAGSTYHPQRGNAIFVTEGAALVYSAVFGQWTTWTVHEADDIVEFGGAYYFKVAGASTIKREDPSTVLDTGEVDQSVLMRIESGWITFGPHLGHQRTWKVLFLGTVDDQAGDSTFVIEFQYNFALPWLHQQSRDWTAKGFDWTAFLGLGTDDTLSEALVLDSRPGKQKHSAIRFSIVDSGSEPARYSLTAVAFEVGVKRGTWLGGRRAALVTE